MVKHTQRGQAIFESMLVLPVVLGSLVFLFWTAKYAIINERLESANRYTQQVLDAQNLFNMYSLMSLYDATSGSPQLPINACATPPPGLLSSTSNVTVNGVTFPRNAVWAANSVTSAPCVNENVSLLQTSGYSHDFLIAVNLSYITANISPPLPRSPFLLNQTPQTQISADTMGTYESASVEDIALCYPDLLSATAASLAKADAPNTISGDQAFVSTPEQLTAQPPTNPLPINTSCSNIPTQPQNLPIGQKTSEPTPQPTPPPNSGATSTPGADSATPSTGPSDTATSQPTDNGAATAVPTQTPDSTGNGASSTPGAPNTPDATATASSTTSPDNGDGGGSGGGNPPASPSASPGNGGKSGGSGHGHGNGGSKGGGGQNGGSNGGGNGHGHGGSPPSAAPTAAGGPNSGGNGGGDPGNGGGPGNSTATPAATDNPGGNGTATPAPPTDAPTLAPPTPAPTDTAAPTAAPTDVPTSAPAPTVAPTAAPAPTPTLTTVPTPSETVPGSTYG